MRISKVKPDEQLVRALTKVIDQHTKKHPDLYVSVTLASLAAVFKMLWKLLPLPRKKKKGGSGYTLAAVLPSVRIMRTPE